jgi:dihydrolipoamide dehydrogenase
MADVDLVVLGGGPAGYASALYAASAGLSVTLIEKEKVGGTCLHRGCVPAKALLHAAEVFRTVAHAGEHGVRLPPGSAPEPDWPAANKRKAGIVNQLHKGLSGLLKRRKVTVIIGTGTLTADGAVSVDGQTVRGRATIICAGSVPRAIPGMEVDGSTVITSDQSTNSDADRLPERVAVIGGGVIGAEFASVYTDLQVATTLLEALPHGVLPIGPDRDCADVLARSLKRRGTSIHAEARVGALERTGHGIVVPFETPQGSDKIEVDQVLVSIGRKPATEGLAAEQAGVRVDQRGFIEIDTATMLTSRPGVYAIGDCVNTPGLAHVAYAEGVLAVQHFLGENPAPVDYGKVPWVVYTHPEVAWAGLTEAAAREAGHDVVVHKHAMAGNARALILDAADGLVKVVAQRDGPVLGFHLVGAWASEMLHEGYLAVNWEALPADVGHLIHAHPSLSEAIGETMITFSGRSLHG